MLSHAVEATCRNCEPGQSECEIAGEVAHRLIRHQIYPERIQVCADGRAATYPHWTFGSEPVQRSVAISAVGRRAGLCLGVSRTVSFGTPPTELQNDHHKTVLIQASGMFFTQANFAMFEIWNRVARIYEKFKCDDSWERTEQAEVIGYELAEYPLVPRSEFQIAPRMPVYWHPAVGAAMSGDSILVGDGRVRSADPGRRLAQGESGRQRHHDLPAGYSDPDAVAQPSRLDDFRVNPRHHRPQLFADLFDLVLAVAAAHGLERGLVGLVLENPFLGELAGLDLVQDLLHFLLGLRR